ncbi:MAG: serine hydrolase domain-containing protein [Pseudomonadota bacterium]
MPKPCYRCFAFFLCLLPLYVQASDASLEKLLADIEAAREKSGVAAVGLTLVDKDKILWTGAFGVKDWDTKEPVDADTLFRIGSITKSFTGLTLLMLQEASKLSLNDPIHQWVPAKFYNNPWAKTHPIRIAHLMEHTAGLHDLSKAEWDFNDPVSLEAGLAFKPESRKVHWPPGIHSSYTNAGAGLAGYVLEQITENTYEKFVEDRIFAPLGMKTASVLLDEATAKKLATGYDTDGKTKTPYWHTIFRPFGAINASPREMSYYLQFLINQGKLNGKQLLKPASIKRLETPKTTLAARSGLEYGYGLGVYHFYHDGIQFYGHGGDGDGYLSRLGYTRANNTGYYLVITAFNHKPLNVIRDLVEDYLTRDLSRPSSLTMPENTELLKALTGEYEPATVRFPGWSKPGKMKITLENGVLYTQKGAGEKSKLIPANAQHFRRPWQPEPTAAIIRDAEGRYVLQGDMGNYYKQP